MGSAAVALVGQAINFAVLASAAIVLPRLLGPEGYGRFSAYMAVVSMLLVVSSLGMPFLEVRFLPPLRRAGKDRELADLTSTLWGVRLAAGILAAGICALWIYRSDLNPRFEITIVVGLFALSRYAFASTRSLLLPLSRVRWFAGLEVTLSVFFLVSFVAGFGISGLEGGFLAAAGATFGLLIWAAALVRAEVPLSLRRIQPRLLRPLLGHGLHTFVGSVASALKVGLPVWAVAIWGGAREGGYFGLSMQAFAVVMGLVFAARQSLMPILAELDDAGEEDRVFLWVGWMLRSSLAVLTAGTLVWALAGREVSVWVLGEDYEPVYGPVTWILVAVVATVAGAMANGLLFLRKHSRVAAWNLIAGSVLTLAGVALVLASRGGMESSRSLAMDAAVAVALGAALFMLVAHVRVWRIESRRLPLVRSMALVLPLALVWPASQWQADLMIRGLAAVGFLIVYSVGSVATRMLDLEGLRYLLRLVLGRGLQEGESASPSDGDSASDSAM